MTYPRYQKYKDSGVQWLGEVPEHWSCVSCREIVAERDERNVDAIDQNYLSLMANIGVLPYEEKGDVGNKKPEDLEKCKKVYVGDFVINSMNYGIGSYGISSYKGVCSPVYIVLTPELEAVESRFAFRIFENKAFQTLAQSFGNGILAHRAAINWDILKNIKIPLPPRKEQIEILVFLDRETAKIDALISEQEKLISLLEEKRQAVISHAVTKGLDPSVPMKDSGIEWIGEVPEHWAIQQIKHIASFRGGGTPSRDNMSYWNGRIPWVSPKDMKMDFIEDAEECITQEGLENSTSSMIPTRQVLMVVRSGILQHTIPVAINSVSVALNQDMKAITFDDLCLPIFFMRWVQGLNDALLLAWAKQGATVESIEHQYLANTCIPLPPVVEQQKIINFLDVEISKVDLLRCNAQKAIDLLKERRSALISAAVTGKIDVRGYAKKEAA